MAGESYYFVFSIVAVVLTVLHIGNVYCFKATGRTILGQKVTPRMLGYKKYKNFASMSGIFVAAVLMLAFVANLAYAIHTISNLGKPDYARGMLIYAPIAIILFFIIMLLIAREKIKSSK